MPILTERHVSLMYSGLVFEIPILSSFQSIENQSFLHLKVRIATKLMFGSVSQIIYQNPVFFKQSRQIFPANGQDDEDAENMFVSHEHFRFNYI